MSLDAITPNGARTLQRLAADRVGWLTTVDPDGRPQCSPVWFLWENGEILIYSLKGAPRTRNIKRNPLVAFNLNTDPDGGDLAIMEGVARVDPTVPTADVNLAYLAKYRATIASGRRRGRADGRNV